MKMTGKWKKNSGCGTAPGNLVYIIIWQKYAVHMGFINPLLVIRNNNAKKLFILSHLNYCWKCIICKASTFLTINIWYVGSTHWYFEINIFIENIKVVMLECIFECRDLSWYSTVSLLWAVISFDILRALTLTIFESFRVTKILSPYLRSLGS